MTLSKSPTSLPHSPRTGGQAREDAVERLDAARDEQERRGQAADAAEDRAEELSTGVELSAANERVAASEAWLSYIERGY
jgi:hypothetical protein